MYCRSCGSPMDENQSVCSNCGVEVGKGDLFCSNCGEVVREGVASCDKCGFVFNKPSVDLGVSFCSNCGNVLDEGAAFCAKCGAAVNKVNNTSAAGGSSIGVLKKDVLKAVILSFVTCGFYGLFWFISLTNDMNKMSGRTSDTNGVTAFILSIVTCGIYGIYWSYKLGEKRDIMRGENSSSNILYLVLTLCGLSLVTYCLAQDSINKAIDANK